MRRTLSTAAGLAALALIALPGLARAQREAAPTDTTRIVRMPPIVVTATRTPTAGERIASDVTVITRAEIERRQYRTVAEALRDVPGVALARSGGPGGVTSVFLRGAAADQTLVLVDGVPVNDPAAPSGAFDFADFLAHDVERIEVLRGPQGPLYGSSAMGGVIQIFTRPAGGPAHASVRVEGGSFGTWEATGSAAGGRGPLAWSASLSRRATDGISAWSVPAGRPEADPDDATGFSGRLGWRPSKRASADLVVRVRTSSAGLDQDGSDDPNYTQTGREGVVRLSGRIAGRNGDWEQTAALAFSGGDRRTRDGVDSAHPQTRGTSRYRGGRWTAQWQATAEGPGGRWSGGVDHEIETARTAYESDGPFGPFSGGVPERSARTTGAFLQDQWAWGGRLFVAVGGRVDDHERFGAAGTWRVAPVLVLDRSGTRIRATWGTGFEAPTLTQLFDPVFGNADLAPERSRGWDAGVDQELAGGRARVGATAFGTRYEDLVGFEDGGYRNVSAARARGVELTGRARLPAGLGLSASYTWTRTEDRSGGPDDGLPLLRRPRHAARLDLQWSGGRADGSLGLRWVGARDDKDFSTFPAERVTLDPYLLVRVSASVRAGERTTFFARVENLLDERYEEVLGYGTPGRAVYVGVEGKL